MLVSTENLQSVLEEIRLAKIISFDCETTGLEAYKNDELFSLIISTEKNDYYFNFKAYPEENISPLPRSTIEDLKLIFLDETKVFLAQNAKFDMHMLAREGIFFAGKIYDTAVLDRIHFNQHMRYNLAEITKRWGDEKLDIVWKYIEENKLKTKTHHERFNKTVEQPHFDRVPFSIIQPYGEQDGAGTLNVGKQILAKIQQDDQTLDPRIPKQMQVVENEARLTKTLFNMERKGIQLDLDYCNEALDHYLRILQKSEIAFKNLTGLDFVKGTTVFEEVFASEKDKWEKTEKGNWKWDADVLETFENPSAKLAIEWAEAKKQSEYFANFLFYCDSKGVLHPTFNQAGTVTGRLSSKDPNCLSMDTTILTKSGWKGPSNISFEDEIANYNIESGELFWAKPTAIVKSEIKKRKMVEFYNEHIKWRLTADHRIVSVNRKSGKISENSAINLSLDSRILHSGITTNLEYKISDDLIKLCVAIQADGNISGSQRQRIRFIFDKKRKKDRLKEILISLNIPFELNEKIWGGRLRYEIKFIAFHLPILTAHKTFSNEVLSFSFRQCVLFLEELKYWDGLSTRDNFDYCTIMPENVDIIQGVASLCGYRAHVYKHSSKISNAFVVSFVRRNYSGTRNLLKKVEEVEEQVWCVSVPSSFIVARRLGDTFITGNCQNLTNPDKYEEQTEAALYPVRKAFVPREGFFFAMIDFSQMEFRMMLDYANANSLINEILKGHDVHTATANVSGTSRKEAKTTNFLTAYSGGVVKLAQGLFKGKLKGSKAQLGAIYKKMFGWRLSDEEQRAWPTVTDELRTLNEPYIRKAYDIQQSIFRAAPEVKDFLKAVQRAAETRGYVRNWLGRRYYFTDKRWAYKAPNHLIQGGSAEVTKIAMNKVDEYLKDKESKMLLSIHDELVVEVRYGEEFVVDEIKKIMEGIWVNRRLPLLVDVEWSEKNLADKSNWSPENFSRGTETRNNIQSKAESST